MITEQCTMVLNGDTIKWFSYIVHLGHHFNCCFSFKKDTNLRKGKFFQYLNEICTEFAFAHPNVNLNYYRYMVGVFMDPIGGIYTARNLCHSVQHGM